MIRGNTLCLANQASSLKNYNYLLLLQTHSISSLSFLTRPKQPYPYKSSARLITKPPPPPATKLAESNNGSDNNYLEEDSPEFRKLHTNNPEVEVIQLEELPENWRRSKLAWLCKELPSHKAPTINRLLNAHKKWMRQPDSTYLVVHCLRIRHNLVAFSVYKWMIQQHWYRFDFALATRLADYMGREKKYAKCREIFDDIINQGRVPSESTFHILIVAYLSAPGDACLREACDIYNRMIHLGAYRPRLSLHNALFKALVSQPASSAKQFLNQAEFVFHNLVTCGLEIHRDIYDGLLRLHSYQNTIDKERIFSLQKEMRQQGIEDTKDTLLSILRACSKDGDQGEAERTWTKLLQCEGTMPSQAYVYKMQVHAKVGDTAKSLEIFREMQEQLKQVSVVAYHKIIEIMCNAQEAQLADSLMKELIRIGLKPIMPSFLNLLNMYFKLCLHDKVESTFFECIRNCRPDRTIYSIYLDSVVQTRNILKAESIFRQMLENDAVGVSSRSCNSLLSGYLHCGDRVKAEKMFGLMCEKSYEVDPSLVEKLELAIRYSKKAVQKSVTLKLTPEQREILVGLLLGGLRVEYAEDKKKHFVCFDFKGDSGMHTVLKRHIHTEYRQWLQPSSDSTDHGDEIPAKFSTVPHRFFSFYADQFWADGRQSVPKLIHRWLSPRALAYWFMYSGHRTPAGNILLKLKGSQDDADRVFKALKLESLEFKVKQKGKVFWLGFTGSQSHCFWRLIEPYVLKDWQDSEEDEGEPSESDIAEISRMRFDRKSDSDGGEEPDYADVCGNRDP